MNSVAWLHLTDLHVGMRDQDWLLPNFRENLFEDLRRLHDRAGPWDFVVFSGDVAQTGARDEFDKATEVLGALWAHLKALGSVPFVVVTPGNHDLVRPAEINPTLRAILHWHEDPQLREEFWSRKSSPYRQLIDSAFENFIHWNNGLPLPKPQRVTVGTLPGDSSCVIEKAGLRVGLVSLNSSFLQLNRWVVRKSARSRCPTIGFGLRWRPREMGIGSRRCAPSNSSPQAMAAPIRSDSLRIQKSTHQGAFSYHRRIRRLEQATCEQHLEAQRCVWILSDWGLATDSFVASVIASLSSRIGIRDLDAFAVECDEASNIEAFRGQAHRQLGLPLQQFLSLAAPLPHCVLVLQNVPTDLFEDQMPDNGATFDDVIRSILDYCPRMRIILTTRSIPNGRFPYVALRALDLPDIRTFVLHHRNGGEKLAEPDAVDILYRRSAGLPIHLDQLLESLRYMTLRELGDSELENSLQSEPTEAVPRDLERAVASLAQSLNRSFRRSFNLLKVLTVLADGESLQRIKHFDQYEPFFPANATQLETLQLIQTLSLPDANPTSVQDNGGSSISETEKLLVAPRQVRDYVRPSIHPSDCNEIIKRAADVVFGAEWRNGKLKSAYFTTAGVGQRNERIILKHLLQDAIARDDASTINRAGASAASVCEGLDRKNRYRESRAIAEAVLPLLEGLSSQQSKFDVAGVNAKALRMLDHPDDAIQVIERILAEGETQLSKDKKSTLYLNLALAHQCKGNSESALEAAKKVYEVSREESAAYLQAEAIIAQQTLARQELIVEWTRLEKIARANNCTIVANNIALDLARAVGGSEADQFRERVIKSQGDYYNQIRAVITKAKSQLVEGQSSATISRQDRAMLIQAYSYLYGQRMESLFDMCHEVLWQLLRAEGLWPAVLRLFRHSSFVWRIYGKLTNERKYVEELSRVSLDALRSGGSGMSDLAYFEGRRLETSEAVSN